MKKWLRGLVIILILVSVYLVWQFAPVGNVPALPDDYQPKIAVWMGVTWSMDVHSDAEIQDLAKNLKQQKIDDAFVYVSYLRADNIFNPTYDHASEFLEKMKQYAPNVHWFAWIGVPISVSLADGSHQDNRLEDEAIREQIAEFAAFTVEDLGFDGVHLNAELIPNHNEAFLQTLHAIRSRLPDSAILSTTAHALRPLRPATSIPYPHADHHWTGDFLAAVGNEVNQIAVMAYDSALPFPRDYRTWMQYQVEETALALSDSEVELLIGVPTSEEWTFTHQTQAETLENALAGFSSGFDKRINGLAIYPYWDSSNEEWAKIHAMFSD